MNFELSENDAKEIKKILHDSWNDIFQVYRDNPDDNDEDMDYTYEEEYAENNLIDYINAHLRHNLLFYRKTFHGWFMNYIVDDIISRDCNCADIGSYQIVGRLYYNMEKIIEKYYNQEGTQLISSKLFI